MKRLTCVLVMVLGAVALATTPVVADIEVGSVTGAGAALLTGGAVLGGVSLDGMELGTGVFIDSNGSATGVFHAVLLGISPQGQPQRITVEGKVSAGALESDGRASFGGTATVDLGDGSVRLPAVAFSVTATANGLILALDATTLPAAALTAGAIVVE
jgi:hypothetical protein